jgi:hypothetical protein
MAGWYNNYIGSSATVHSTPPAAAIGSWDNFSQRDVTMAAPNCVIDASAFSGSGESANQWRSIQ